jgi:glycosyltransferase involved in cell wall biosynthesis
MGYSIPELQKQHPDIIITGPKRGKDLINYYHSADIFLFTSKNDSFGLVLLEALASGLPIVGFNTYGPRDVVPKGTGVSYLADKDEELQTCAVKAWEDLQNGLITHQQCRDYAAQFSWDVAVDKLLLSLTQIMVLPDDEDESCCVCKC